MPASRRVRRPRPARSKGRSAPPCRSVRPLAGAARRTSTPIDQPAPRRQQTRSSSPAGGDAPVGRPPGAASGTMCPRGRPPRSCGATVLRTAPPPGKMARDARPSTGRARLRGDGCRPARAIARAAAGAGAGSGVGADSEAGSGTVGRREPPSWADGGTPSRAVSRGTSTAGGRLATGSDTAAGASCSRSPGARAIAQVSGGGALAPRADGAARPVPALRPRAVAPRTVRHLNQNPSANAHPPRSMQLANRTRRGLPGGTVLRSADRVGC
jgi:hypothetical protein